MNGNLIMLTRSVGTLALLAAVALADPARSQSLPYTFKGADTSSVCAGDQTTCRQPFNRPNIGGEVKWAAGLLYGEPVVDVRLSWEPGSLTNHLPPSYARADPLLGSMGTASDAAQQMRLYDAKARLTVDMGGSRYTLDADLGIPGKPGGEQSYNVAGSPDWSRLFRDSDGEFVSAEQAKWIFESGAMARATAEIVQARVDTSKFEAWWLEQNVERYAGPLRNAIDARLDALGNAFGLPTKELRAEIAALGPGLKGTALIGKLEEILFKLSPDRLPAKFLGQGPDRLWRVKAYAERIRGTETALRDAMAGLPPMPGSGRRYDSWYEQQQVRLNSDAARLARLQDLQDEADRLEREAEEARQRERDRIAREEERRREEEEWRARQDWNSGSGGIDWGAVDWGSVISDAFSDTGWGYGSGPGGFTVPGYYYQGIYIGSSSSESARSSGNGGNRCGFRYPVFEKGEKVFRDDETCTGEEYADQVGVEQWTVGD